MFKQKNLFTEIWPAGLRLGTGDIAGGSPLITAAFPDTLQALFLNPLTAGPVGRRHKQ